MENHYTILGIDPNADTGQIKRAYFSMVRKFPPEKYPDRFMKIRTAYEILSDTESRAQYDEHASLPADAAVFFLKAKKAYDADDIDTAISHLVYLLSVYPDLHTVRFRLATYYLDNENTGKAIKELDYLHKNYPELASYSATLVSAYINRGWTKKAVTLGERLILQHPDSLITHTALLAAYITAKLNDKAFDAYNNFVSTFPDIDSEELLPASCAYITHCINTEDSENANIALAHLIKSLKATPPAQEQSIHMLFLLLSNIKLCDPAISAPMTPHVNELMSFLKSMASHSDDNQYFTEALQLFSDFLFSNADFGEVITTIIDILNSIEDEDRYAFIAGSSPFDDDYLDLLSLECCILSDVEGYRPLLERLSNEFPQFYALNKAFFDAVLNSRSHSRLLNTRMKILSHQDLVPVIVFADGSTPDSRKPETYRRDGDKIGRNDPCPCGSGRKYKKCCGV